MKRLIIILIALGISSAISQAAENQLHTFITRGNDKIVYSGGKDGLRAILMSFLMIQTDEPISIYSQFETTADAGGKQFNLNLKSRTHSFEIKNGFHRFTVLPDRPEDEVYAITATKTLEEAVTMLVEDLYKLKN